MRNSLTIVIRPAVVADAQAIAAIYNEAILTTTATFDTETKSDLDRVAWLAAHDERHPVLAAEFEQQLIGYASLSRWSERRAYDDTAETSFYVKSEFRGQGVGRRLKEAILEEARRLGFHSVIARVAQGSEESLHLNLSMGFVLVGTLKEVGLKFGKRLDVHVLQMMMS